MAYNVKGRFDKADTVEFLIKTEGIQDRNWEGDKDGPAVFFRSIAGDLLLLLLLRPPPPPPICVYALPFGFTYILDCDLSCIMRLNCLRLT